MIERIYSSYMITNRADPENQRSSSIFPTPPGSLFFYQAPGADNPRSNEYQRINKSAMQAMPASYREALAADIRRVAQAGGGQVTLYIHGLAYSFSDACQALGTYGENLAAQGYKGLLVGFSWPSYGQVDSVLYYASRPYAFPPKASRGTIRDNINGSTASLLNLLLMLATLCEEHGATLNLICHSEGNYMLMLAMHAASQSADPSISQLASGGPLLDRTLLVAADINNGALQPGEGSPTDAGQGSWIARQSRLVTVYWSDADKMLLISDQWTRDHNPSFPSRLGRHGPDSFAAGRLLPNVYGLDTSQVVNERNPHTPWNVSVHESYFYIPQVLSDMSQTLQGVPPDQVAHRQRTGSTNAFKMELVAGSKVDVLQTLGVPVPSNE